MTAVLLALTSAALFGGMTVALRLGLRGARRRGGRDVRDRRRRRSVVALAAAAFHPDLHGAWPFLLAGLLAPGGSQILFTLARARGRRVADVGDRRRRAARRRRDRARRPRRAAARAARPRRGRDRRRRRPARRRARPARSISARIGLVYAAAAAALFATRDNLVRALHTHATPETAAAATLIAGRVVAALWTRRAPTRRELRRLAPAGVLFGLSYVCLFEAYFRGRVSVVSPLVATESLWGVGLSALLIRQTEGMGRRLALGALLVVAGGALIGATR